MNIKKIKDIFKRDREVSLYNLSLETGESEADLKYNLLEVTILQHFRNVHPLRIV